MSENNHVEGGAAGGTDIHPDFTNATEGKSINGAQEDAGAVKDDFGTESPLPANEIVSNSAPATAADIASAKADIESIVSYRTKGLRAKISTLANIAQEGLMGRGEDHESALKRIVEIGEKALTEAE